MSGTLSSDQGGSTAGSVQEEEDALREAVQPASTVRMLDRVLGTPRAVGKGCSGFSWSVGARFG